VGRYTPAKAYHGARERIRTSTPITGTRPSTGCLPLIPRGVWGTCPFYGVYCLYRFYHLRINSASDERTRPTRGDEASAPSASPGAC